MGEKGKVLATPFSPEWGKAHTSNEQSFDTLCGSVRQDAGGAGTQVSVAAAEAMSEVWRGSGLGARVRRSLF
jgi:hypothetical protein